MPFEKGPTLLTGAGVWQF